jgi:prepilin-type N-terminal cleavage/methylation domain-containing protein
MKPQTQNTGFTLIEILVVLGIIGIVAGITLPGIVQIFSAGAEGQAYSVVNSLLRSARAHAIENSVYTLVHFQPADRSLEEFDDRWAIYAAVMEWDRDNQVFTMPKGFEPVAIPGGVGIGRVSSDFFDDNGDIKAITDSAAEEFVTVNVIFSPEGKVVRRAPTADGKATFDLANGKLFDGDVRIWSPDSSWGQESIGVTALTFFPLTEFMNLTSDSARRYFLGDKAAFTGINLYTGQMFPRK